MKVVVFAHPEFLGSTSMPLFADSLVAGLEGGGIHVRVLTPRPVFHRLPCPSRFRKWLGYLDQFLIFPVVARIKTWRVGRGTIFVFCDQALGPWVPAFARYPHAVHCHDFLALRSALGEFKRNKVSPTGKVYQGWIRRGFGHARNFICVSHRSKLDLERFIDSPERARIRVVHNGLNYPFSPMVRDDACQLLGRLVSSDIGGGFLLHVGGNQWYKNRAGVIEIYSEYVRRTERPLPLLMIGAQPDSLIDAALRDVPAHGRVEFVVRPRVEVLRAAYSLASALVFPSIAEGFGWPIIEAMACGCPVLTTNEAPMTEVGGSIAFYLPPPDLEGPREWAASCADILERLLAQNESEKEEVRRAGLAHAHQFNGEDVVKQYINIYRNILAEPL